MPRILSPRIDFKEYAAQYLAGNVIATVVALVAGIIVYQHTGSAIITALVASVCESVIWYIYIAAYYIRRKGDSAGQALHNLVADFGLAEVLDSFLIRPGLMYLLPKITGSQASGIVCASVAADVIYAGIALNRQRHRALGS